MANKPFAKGSVEVMLGTAVNTSGTVNVPYPAGLVQADLLGSTGGVVVINDNDVYPQGTSGTNYVGVSFGASNITLTNNTAVSWPAGAKLIASFGGYDHSDSLAGVDDTTIPALEARVTALENA